jgi:predicted lipoprotein with Yx(FWY)xxD motif
VRPTLQYWRVGIVAFSLVASGAVFAACGSSSPPSAVHLRVEVVKDFGSVLAGPKGHTLYTFAPDTANTSTCTGPCVSGWPPFTVAAGTTVHLPSGVAGTLGTITRSGGAIQVVYDTRPLYYFGYDVAPGDIAGEGVNSQWYAVRIPAQS